MISLTELARRLCGAAFAGVLGLVAISTSVPAETRFGPGYPERALLGPQAAQGAVIWNHGTTSYYGALDSSQSAIPAFVAALSGDRWDVFRLDRPPAGESPNTSTEALLAAISQLKAQGYRRIVLMGQSAGAWISLIAAGKSADVHAVIATAPAYYGVNRPKNTMNASALYGYLEGIKAARVMLAFFTDDPYDPGGRGAEADAILGRNGVPRLIVDRPEGLSGHGAGTSGLFYRRYGPCLRAIMGDGAVPKLSECQTDWGSKPSGEVQLPKDLAIARTGTGPAAPLVGTWWGVYLNGRELVLAVERADGDAVKAVYATGPLPGAVNKLDYVRVDGKVDGAGLSFERPGKAALHFRLRPDGDLDAEWIASDGTGRLTAILRRLQD